MDECLFCKIIRGDIPSQRVYEDENTYAFLDINPVQAGHTLVVPKKHATNIFDIAPDDWAATTETVRKLAGAIEAATGASGINLMMNNRAQAGQVIDHVHVHIIPRHRDDGLTHWPGTPYADGEDAQVAERIRQHVS